MAALLEVVQLVQLWSDCGVGMSTCASSQSLQNGPRLLLHHHHHTRHVNLRLPLQLLHQGHGHLLLPCHCHHRNVLQ